MTAPTTPAEAVQVPDLDLAILEIREYDAARTRYITALEHVAQTRIDELEGQLESALEDVTCQRHRAEALLTVLGLLADFAIDEVLDGSHPMYAARVALGLDGRTGARDIREADRG